MRGRERLAVTFHLIGALNNSDRSGSSSRDGLARQTAACAGRPRNWVRCPRIRRAARHRYRVATGSIAEQFGHRVQLLHVLRHDLDDDDDRNAEQHAPDAPEPSPE